MGKKGMILLFNLFFFALIGIKNTEKELEEYVEKKRTLETNIKNFSEEEKIERVARDKLNLKKEGEITYKIIE